MFENYSHKISKRDEVLNAMEKSSKVFHLTGSRFSGNYRSESDYDFFVEDAAGIPAFLQNLGFVTIFDRRYPKTGIYGDVSSSKVMRHSSGIDVQIILPEYMQAKQFANHFLLKTAEGDFLLKSKKSDCAKKSLWTAVIYAAFKVIN